MTQTWGEVRKKYEIAWILVNGTWVHVTKFSDHYWDNFPAIGIEKPHEAHMLDKSITTFSIASEFCSGPLEVWADENFLHLCSDSFEGHAMMGIDKIDELIKCLQEIRIDELIKCLRRSEMKKI